VKFTLRRKLDIAALLVYHIYMDNKTGFRFC